jgi:hypothetical protein
MTVPSMAYLIKPICNGLNKGTKKMALESHSNKPSTVVRPLNSCMQTKADLLVIFCKPLSVYLVFGWIILQDSNANIFIVCVVSSILVLVQIIQTWGVHENNFSGLGIRWILFIGYTMNYQYK